MAVPSSGVLSLLAIHNELAENDYSSGTSRTNVSLEDLSDGTVATINTSNNADDRPDGSAPHAMSEFYVYDHDAGGVPQPSNMVYTAVSTTAIRFQFDEPVGVTRVYFYQGSAASFTIFDNSPLKIDGNTAYITVNGSGTTTLNISDDNSDDQLYNTSIGGYVNIDLGPNDFMDISLKSYSNTLSAFSDMTSDIRGYTLPDFVSNMSTTSISSHAMTINWDAPSGGVNSTNGYRYYHGTNSTVANNSAVDTGNTSVALTGLSANTTYYWSVQTKGDGGDFQVVHPSTNTVLTAPDAVGTITATPGVNNIALSWASTAAGTSEYRAYFGTNSTVTSNSTSTIANDGKNATDFTSLTTSTTYYFGIQPRNSDGNYGDIVTGNATTLAQTTYSYHAGSTSRGFSAISSPYTTTTSGVGSATSTLSRMIRVTIANGNAAAVTIETNNPTPALGTFEFLASDTEGDVVGTSPSGTFQALTHSFNVGNWSQGGVTAYFFRLKWNHGTLPAYGGQQTSTTVRITTTNTGASPVSGFLDLVIQATA